MQIQEINQFKLFILKWQYVMFGAIHMESKRNQTVKAGCSCCISVLNYLGVFYLEKNKCLDRMNIQVKII